MLSSALGRFRLVSLVEGLSNALLVFVAMPLKYGLGQPQMVRVMGMAHGLLFVAFAIALLLAWRNRGWSFGLDFAARLRGEPICCEPLFDSKTNWKHNYYGNWREQSTGAAPQEQPTGLHR